MPELRDLGDSPFGDIDSGEYVSLDGTTAGPIQEEDVEAVLYHGDTGDAWDGVEAAILKLKDGRFVGYETWWGPTGSGFSEDAYGGDAKLCFGADLDTVARLALSDESRRLVSYQDTSHED